MRWIVIIAVVVMIAVLPVRAAQTEDRWQFAYITGDADGRTLWLVDPEDLQTRDYPLTNAEAWLKSAQPSPDGQYIALWFNDPPHSSNDDVTESSVLRLLDMSTGAMRDIARLPYYNDEDFSSTDVYNMYPLWSPDSRYITHLDTVYDVATGDSYVLAVPVQTREWSPDSSTLAVGTVNCHDQYCSSVTLTTVHVPDMTVIQTSVFEDWADICDLQWSPDQQTVVFHYRCFFLNSGLFGNDEIVAWNLPTNTITPLTRYTRTQEENYNLWGGVPDGVVSYSTLWLDSQTLLVSVQHWDYISTPEGYIPDVTTFRVGTDVYHFPAGTHTRVSEEWINVFAKNPVHQQVAYAIQRIVVKPDGTIARLHPRIEIAGIDGESLTVQQTLLEGCALQWSPSGDWLAFTDADRRRLSNWHECYQPTTLYFAASDANTLPRSIHLPKDALVVGWVRTAPGQAPYFPGGTPTPIPTPAVTGMG